MTLDAATIALLAALAAFASKATSLVKFVRATDWSALRAQVVVFALGIAGPYLASGSDLNASVQPLSGAGKAFLGVLIGSVGSIVRDIIKAIDANTSTAEPPL